MSLPPYTVYYRGLPACPCLAEWYPAYEAELQRRGILQPGQQVYIYQLIGGADASAGTHRSGGAADDNQTSEAATWVARQMGADASWPRVPPAFTFHSHRVLRGCPHNGPARYQIDAVDAGFNGLGAGGRGGPDDGPRPLSGRTWREGIAWAREQGDFMATDEALDLLNRIIRQGEAAKRRDVHLREKIIKPLVELVSEHAGDAATRASVKRQADRIIAALDEDPE